MRDNTFINQHDDESMIAKLSVGDPTNLKMTGQIIDRIYKNGELVDVIEGHNLVVNSFLKLVMSLCKGTGSGIQYWAVGSGEASWDTTLPNPEINAIRLTTELGRVAIPTSEITFLTADLVVSETPTNILQIKHTFGPNDCNGKWREFGLFGGDATGVANSGIMINKRHHAVITKTSEMSIERTMTFTLNLV